ncbi:MAG: dTDP-4-dehydrorhamnose reductase [Acidobacteria bacterium]|nr:dTDP-4-dehydrorhamnose reductase [Acidobacteriota bacterium]
MRLLITGSRGQLGRALERLAPGFGHEFVGVDLPELDITDAEAVRRAVEAASPDAIVNCAAYTAVDAAESDEAKAAAVNGGAVSTLAETADRHGIVLLQISTDYVFDGTALAPIREGQATSPQSAYGRTKLAGEVAAARARRHLIVRTAWLYGEGSNFVGAVRRQLDGGNRVLRVVADQAGCPTYAEDLASGLLRLLDARAEGVVHAVNSGATTWYGFAREIVRLVGSDAEVVPISTGEMPRPAKRPAYSVLDTSRLAALIGAPLPPWQDALERHLRAGR